MMDLFRPRGGRNKFLRKAKEMLKRHDSKSSVDQERKNENNGTPIMQRSRSCGTILGSVDTNKKNSIGDRSSDFQIDHTDTSDKEDLLTDSDGSEIIDCGGPTPKLKSSRLSNTDTYSMISSISQQDSRRSSIPANKLVPGSMSIFDRDEDDKIQNKEMIHYFKELNNTGKDKQIQNVNKPTETQNIVMRNQINLKSSKLYQRPQTSLDSITSERRQLPATSINVSKASNGNTDSLVFGNISSRNTSNQNYNDSSSVSSNDTSIVVAPVKKPVFHPNVPLRKQSLPVTDRFEEELNNPDIVHDILPNRGNEYTKKLSYPIISPRAQSTTPGSASSKTILQRMQRSSNASRPKTPTAELTKLSTITNNNNINNSTEIPPHNKPRPQTSLGAPIPTFHIRKPPINSQRNESSIVGKNSSDIDDFVEKRPTPPMRRESDKNKSVYNNGSNNSDKSDKNKKSKLYYEYGNV